MIERRKFWEAAKRATARSLPVLVWSLTACAAPREESRPGGVEAAATDLNLTAVVVAIDGVRWQDIFNNASVRLPHLRKLMHQTGAALGAPDQGPAVFASGPNFVSKPGYQEILSGRRDVPCVNNGCTAADETTLADDFAAGSPGKVGSVAIVSSWPGVGDVAARYPARLLLSAGRVSGSNRELLITDKRAHQLLALGDEPNLGPGHSDFRSDRKTAAIGLAYLAQQKPSFLFLGLGEPDEYGHQNQYEAYLRSLSAADSVIGELLEILEELGNEGRRTLLVVTTDHGRADNFMDHGQSFPESARAFIIFGGTEVRRRGLIRSKREHRLADIAPTIRRVAGLPEDHSERAGQVIEEIFAH